MRRCTLHIKHLEPFKKWLEAQDIPFRDGRGAYQVLQVWVPHKGKYNWSCVYSRDEMPEHYTAQEHLLPTVRRFINDLKIAKNDPA